MFAYIWSFIERLHFIHGSEDVLCRLRKPIEATVGCYYFMFCFCNPIWNLSFSTNAKFAEKLTFLTP